MIFDTDMGPDCDDAGAFALLFHYIKKYDLTLLGAANCTSNRYANGTIRAIAEYFGCPDLPVGQYSGSELLPDGKNTTNSSPRNIVASPRAPQRLKRSLNSIISCSRNPRTAR